MKRLLLTSTLLLGLAAAGPVWAEQDVPPPGIPRLMSYDTNGDGALSAEEIAAAHTAALKRMDTNGDGAISKDEFLKAPRGRGPDDDDDKSWRATRREANREAHFAALDTDKDGTISAEEWAATKSQSPMLQHLDTNHDGMLSKEELAAMPGKGRRHGDGRWGNCDGSGKANN